MAATVVRPSRWYTTREQAKAFMGLAVADKDARIDAHIAQASRMIEQHTDRRFIPLTATKEFDYQGAKQLLLGDDLLAVTTLSAETTVISASDYFLYPLNALNNEKPYLWIELLFTDETFAFADTKQSAITILGKWGYSELTRDTGATTSASLNASATSIAVSNWALVEVGQTWLLGTEQCFVRDVSGNTVTITRAMNGTTAASHDSASVVYELCPPDDIRFACNVLVARFLHRGDAAWSDRAGDPTQGFTYFRNLPTEVKDILKLYKRLSRTPVRTVS